MIDRDWLSFLDELLTYKELNFLQDRIKIEAVDSCPPLRDVLLALGHMRCDQLVQPLPEQTTADHEQAAHEALLAWMQLAHATLTVPASENYKEAALRDLAQHLADTMLLKNEPKPGESLAPQWREFLEEMLEEHFEDNRCRIRELGLHYILSLPHRTCSTLLSVLHAENAASQFLYIQEALDAPPYRVEFKLVHSV